MYSFAKKLEIILITLACQLGILAGTSLEAKHREPNILFIMSDDHASEAIGAYDSWLKKYCPTPTIDRLAAEGMRFTNVCCNNSICSPSRASILTGQYSHKNGVPNLNGGINEFITTFSITISSVNDLPTVNFEIYENLYFNTTLTQNQHYVQSIQNLFYEY